MKKANYILCVILVALLSGCATPVSVSHLSLEVCRDGLRGVDKELTADSTVHHLFKREVVDGKTRYIIKWVDSEKYNESGYLLREHSVHERIRVQSGDTIRYYCFNRNVFDDNGELAEHYKYINDTLRQVNRFAYNKKGQLVEYVSQDVPEENYVPLKYRYAYDRYGNICLEERYENNVLQWRACTKYNRRGLKLEEAHYRGDGTLDNKTIYSYNHRGEKVDRTDIEERNKLHIMGGENWEQNPFERDYWLEQNSKKQEPITQFDTITYRTTYHSKGKIATTQKRRNQGEWVVTSRTEYNRKGVPTKQMKYRWSDEDGKWIVGRLIIYNSQGLPIEEYSYDRDEKVMKIISRKEYNERGKVVVDIDYYLWRRDAVGLHYYAYDQDDNVIDEWYYEDGGTMRWRTTTQYENGKQKRVLHYGEKGVLKSVEVFEEENGELKITKYDKDGAIIEVHLSQNSDTGGYTKGYNAKGDLILESSWEYFK